MSASPRCIYAFVIAEVFNAPQVVAQKVVHFYCRPFAGGQYIWISTDGGSDLMELCGTNNGLVLVGVLSKGAVT